MVLESLIFAMAIQVSEPTPANLLEAKVHLRYRRESKEENRFSPIKTREFEIDVGTDYKLERSGRKISSNYTSLNMKTQRNKIYKRP